jgi:hypothetical protein
MPRLQNGAGMSGGIGGQFASMYKAPAGKGNDGRASAMGGSLAARTKGSPKYAVPNFNKKGAHAQAKFAGKMGAQGAYSADGAGMRTSATEAFSGETSGSGDVGAGEGGMGMGGAGISNGSKLKGSDPSLSGNNSTPAAIPPATPPEDVSPWNDLLTAGLICGGSALLLIATTKILGKQAKAGGTAAAGYYIAACITAGLAVAAALAMVVLGILLMVGKKSDPADPEKDFEGQLTYGGILVALGLKLAVAAWDALCGLEKGSEGTHQSVDANKNPMIDTKGKPVMEPNSVSTPMAGYSTTSMGLNDLFKGM